jgi:uncharacterized membrane protein HdeD (DUF308 family)
MSDITGHEDISSRREFAFPGIDSELAARLREESARHWKLLLAIGILCDLVGVYSILVPIVASISVTVLVGWALVVGGIVQLGFALRGDLAWSWDVAWRLFACIITIVAGVFILLAPLTGTFTLTVVLVAWLWALGVIRLIAWWKRRGFEGNWITGVTGVAAILLGILIWADLPSSATWALGLLVGIELLLAGTALIMMAFAGRQLARGAEGTA